jgi:hypothetical protein
MRTRAQPLLAAEARVCAFLVASILTRGPPEHPEDDRDRDRGHNGEDDPGSDHLHILPVRRLEELPRRVFREQSVRAPDSFPSRRSSSSRWAS